MDLEAIVLRELSRTKTNSIQYHLYVECKIRHNELICDLGHTQSLFYDWQRVVDFRRQLYFSQRKKYTEELCKIHSRP